MRFTKLFTSATATIGAALLAVACGHSQNGTHESAAQVAGDVLTDTAAHASAADSLMARADSARIQGSPSAPLWIIEVSDFQCPFCRMFHAQTYPTIKKDYVETGKARLAYINFPVPGHQNAWPAALAAMCAAAQGKFWPMHDALFNSQDSWGELKDPTPVFDSLATSVGADMTSFNSCVSKKIMMPLVQADRSRAEEHGVNATPTFLIGTQRIVGAESISTFRRVIDAELAKSRGSAK